MGIISAIGTAVPPYRVEQDRAQEFCHALFGGTFTDIDRLLPVFRNAHIDERYFSVPAEWFERDHTFGEKNDLYVRTALEVGRSAIDECLGEAGLGPEEIDHFFLVSTTGLATPSIDARLINLMKMRRDIRRTPIWGLGCAGGAAGLSRAFEFVKAYPGSRALLLALELCGLTFQHNDLSKSNLVATSLFADGAAAVVVGGDSTGSRGPRILDSRSTLWYDSLEVMGWEVNDQGLKVLFSRDIPSIVRNWVLPGLLEFLSEHGLELSQVRHLVAHPGGAKVIEAYEEALCLKPGQMDFARDVLRRYGNMSAPTVLFVLKEFLRSGVIQPGEYGVITALGPGFSSEMLLIRG